MKVKKLGPNMTELQFEDGTRVLVSYETPVAAFVPATGEVKRTYEFGYVKSEKFFSRTTSKHIGQWLDGIDARVIPQSELARIVEGR